MNERLTQILRRAAQIHARGVATLCNGRRRSWSEVLDRVERSAGGLRERGVKPGDRVAVLALNSDRYLEAYFAIPWCGGVIVPLNTRLATADLIGMLNDAQVGTLCVDQAFLHVLPEVRSHCPDLKTVVALDDKAGECAAACDIDWESLCAADPLEDNCGSGDDLAGIFYTGGSTGRSKGVMLSQRNLVSNAVNALHMIGYGPDSVFLHAAPMCHLTDGMSTLGLTLAAGTHTFIPKFDAAQVLEVIERDRVTNLTLVPTMIAMLLDEPAIHRRDLSSLRQFMFGSAPISEGTLRRVVAVWPDMLFLHGWGMTELAPLGTMLPHHMRSVAVAGDRLRSCGQAMPNLDLRIVDGAGQEVGRGVTGEIVVRGPGVMLGYWNRPAETAAVLRDGWLHTGDAAVMDEEGYVYIVDRMKDMIISGGENIYSTEVENAISLMPGVAEVAVIGIPDEKWGERVHAIVVPEHGHSLEAEDVQRWARERLAGYKVPRSVLIRHESLPVSGAGKVLKSELRAPYWQASGRKI